MQIRGSRLGTVKEGEWRTLSAEECPEHSELCTFLMMLKQWVSLQDVTVASGCKGQGFPRVVWRQLRG